MSDFFDNKGKNLNTRQGLHSYTHGVVCAMNRFYRTGISQAIQDLYPCNAIDPVKNVKAFFDWICDAMLLASDSHHKSYWRALFYIHQHICHNKEELENSRD